MKQSSWITMTFRAMKKKRDILASNHRGSSAYQDVCVPGFKTLTDPRQPTWRKLFWFLLYLGFTTLTVVQLTSRVRHYFTYPVTLTYELKQFHSLQFPKVSVCPYWNPAGDLENDLWQATAANVSNVGLFMDLVTNCSYAGGKSCHNASLWEAQEMLAGLCYTLNIMDDFHNVGPSSGIKLILNDYDGTELDFPQSKWQIMIHKDLEDSMYEYFSNSVLISDKLVTTIVYTQKLFVFKNVPNRPCYPKQVVDRCLQSCMDSGFLEVFHCRLPFMKTVINPLCSHSAQDALRGIRTMALFDMLRDCQCGKACAETMYELQVDTRVENRSQAVVYVLPTREEVEILKEKPAFTVYALVCEIGGTLGLYLGACLLTFVELFDSTVSLLCTKMSQRRVKPRTPYSVVITFVPYYVSHSKNPETTLRSVKFTPVSQ